MPGGLAAECSARGETTVPRQLPGHRLIPRRQREADCQAGDAISPAVLSLPGTRTTPQAHPGLLQPLPADPGAGGALT